jgi:hypothetical protein
MAFFRVKTKTIIWIRNRGFHSTSCDKGKGEKDTGEMLTEKISGTFFSLI